jgi:hypothetical protein
MYLGTDGRFYVATFMYPHLTHKTLSLYNADYPNVSFSKNLTLLQTKVYFKFGTAKLHKYLHTVNIKYINQWTHAGNGSWPIILLSSVGS